MRLAEPELAVDFVRVRGSTAVWWRPALFCDAERCRLVTDFSGQPIGPIFSGGRMFSCLTPEYIPNFGSKLPTYATLRLRKTMASAVKIINSVR
jgi:hypothetical protein